MAEIILTGATGYLGSHLANALLADGHKVRALMRQGSKPGRLSEIMNRLHRIDIDGSLERASLDKAFDGIGSDAWLVQCATVYGRHGESRSEIVSANLFLPLALLDAAAEAGIRYFLNTDTVLSADTNAYALSKGQFRDWVRLYAEDGSFKVVNLALEHFFGPGDGQTKFPTWVTRQCLRNVPEILLSEGTQVRDFVYINDVIDAYRSVLSATWEQNWNSWRVGTAAPVTVRAFVETIHQFTKSSSQLKFGAVTSRAEPEVTESTPSLEQANTGWKPKWGIEHGLLALIDGERAAMNQEKE
jgi:CDP-paratose synthetase